MSARMKLRELESNLQEVEVFEEPKILLEQYPTSPHIAACMLHTIQSSYGDIADKSICDLGCGTGMLGIASVMMGAASVLSLDIDSDALGTCKENFESFEMEEENVDFLQLDLKTLNVKNSRFYKMFDTVVMNPPFGTKHSQGIDMLFLKSALDMATGSVYSLHKTSTREHVMKKAKDLGAKSVQVLAELRYDLPKTFKHHKLKSVDIQVDFLRFSLTN